MFLEDGSQETETTYKLPRRKLNWSNSQ